MLNKATLCAALAAALTVGAAAQAAEVSVHGSTTVANALLVPNKGEIELKSGHRLTIVANGSGSGVRDLLAGDADIAMISAHLGDVVAKLNEQTPGSVDETRLVATLVGITRAAFVVHPSNPVASIDREAATAILSGRITNWRELGGPDAAIQIVVEESGGGVRSMIEKQLLDGGDIAGSASVVDGGGAAVVSAVAGDSTAFGVTAGASVDDSVRELEIGRGIRQPLNMVTIGEPAGAAAEVIQAARDLGFFRSAAPGAGNEREIMASLFFPTSAPSRRHGEGGSLWVAGYASLEGRWTVNRAMEIVSSM